MKQVIEIDSNEIKEIYERNISKREVKKWMHKSKEDIGVAMRNIKKDKIISFLSQKFQEIEQYNEMVAEVRITPRIFQILRGIGILEVSYNEDDLGKGIISSLWGANVYAIASYEGEISRETDKIIFISTDRYINET